LVPSPTVVLRSIPLSVRPGVVINTPAGMVAAPFGLLLEVVL